MDFSTAESKLLDLFGCVLEFCDIGRAFDRCSLEDMTGPERHTRGKIYVVAIGKSAAGMAEELIKRFDVAPFTGIVAGPVLRGWSHPRFQTFEGGHPLPNQESMDAPGLPYP